MSRKAIKAINWSAISERLHEADKPVFAMFKAKSDQYLKNLQQYPETAPKIDWAYYKQHVPVAGMVEKFQKEYESLSIPYPADKYTSTIEAQEKQMLAAVEAFIAESNKRIEEYTVKAEEVKSRMPYSEMTMEDFKDYHPELAIDHANRPTIWPNDPNEQEDLLQKDEEEKSSH